MRDIIRTNIFKTFDDFSTHRDDYMGALFINIFNKLPKVYKVFFDNKNEIVYHKSIQRFDYYKDVGVKFNNRTLIEKSLDEEKENKDLLVFAYSSNQWLIIYDNEESNCSFLMHIGLRGDDDSADYYTNVYTDNIDVSFNIIKNWIEKVDHKSNVEYMMIKHLYL